LPRCETAIPVLCAPPQSPWLSPPAAATAKSDIVESDFARD
jgi:hypothetical protein